MNRYQEPIIILVHPQLGENIGATARAMLNCGLKKLRIVKPRDGWPNSKAIRASSGAESIIHNAGVYLNSQDAVSDLNYVIACTARKRDLRKEQADMDNVINGLIDNTYNNLQCGILFGNESSGLSNDDLDFADILLSIPTNKEFTSLNLSHAVLIVCFHWMIKFQSKNRDIFIEPKKTIDQLAKKSDLSQFFDHLERDLEKGGFLFPPEKAPKMIKNLRSIFIRSNLNEQEVKTLRGVISALKRAGKSL